MRRPIFSSTQIPHTPKCLISDCYNFRPRAVKFGIDINALTEIGVKLVGRRWYQRRQGAVFRINATCARFQLSRWKITINQRAA